MHVALFIRSLAVLFLLGFSSLAPAQSQPSPSPTPAPIQKKLIVGACDRPPYVIKGEGGLWSGLAVDLWENIAQRMNWTYEYKEVAASDIVAQIKSGQLDLMLAELPVEAGFEKQIDFSQPFLASSLGVVTPIAHDWAFILLRTFFTLDFMGIMLVILAGIVLFSVLIWAVERRRESNHFGGNKLHGFGSAVWFSAVTMTTVGYGDKTPQTVSGRIIAFVWMMAGVVIIAAFTGIVVASITAERIRQTVTHSSDLAHMRTGVIENGDAWHVLKKRGITPVVFPTHEAALEALLSGKIQAVVGDRAVLSYLLHHHHYTDRLQLMNIRFHDFNIAFALPDHSPLREPIDVQLLEITQASEWRERLRFWLGSQHSPEFR